MPRPRRRARGRRLNGYTLHHLMQLESGHVHFVGRGFATADDARAGWEDLRDDLLARWLAMYPGTRPSAWWTFDAMERRRRIDGKPHPFDNADRLKRPAFAVGTADPWALHFGKPRIMATRDEFDAVYESEHDYLVRLDLLTADEAALIASRGGHLLTGTSTIPLGYWVDGEIDLDDLPIRELSASELAEIAHAQQHAHV